MNAEAGVKVQCHPLQHPRSVSGWLLTYALFSIHNWSPYFVQMTHTQHSPTHLERPSYRGVCLSACASQDTDCHWKSLSKHNWNRCLLICFWLQRQMGKMATERFILLRWNLVRQADKFILSQTAVFPLRQGVQEPPFFQAGATSTAKPPSQQQKNNSQQFTGRFILLCLMGPLCFALQHRFNAYALNFSLYKGLKQTKTWHHEDYC